MPAISIASFATLDSCSTSQGIADIVGRGGPEALHEHCFGRCRDIQGHVYVWGRFQCYFGIRICVGMRTYYVQSVVCSQTVPARICREIFAQDWCQACGSMLQLLVNADSAASMV